MKTGVNGPIVVPPPPRNCHELANPGHSKQICETNVEILADPWRWRKTWASRPFGSFGGESLWWKKRSNDITRVRKSRCCNPFKGRVEGYDGYDTRIPKHCTIYFPFLVYKIYMCSYFCSFWSGAIYRLQNKQRKLRHQGARGFVSTATVGFCPQIQPQFLT